jgi:polyphosphate kinase
MTDLYGARFVALEDVIAAHLDQLFPGMEVHEHFTFRVTRNEDLEVEEDDAENLLTALEKELTRRRFGPPVRLEVDRDMDDHVLDLLTRELQCHRAEVFRLPSPLDLRGLNTLADLDRSELKYPPFVPRTHPDLAPTESSKAADIFAAVRAKDVLLHHPYDSFSTSVQAFIEQAAADPGCWRSSRPSTAPAATPRSSTPSSTRPRPASRCSPSSRSRPGSTSRTTSWARKLEHAGVHVVYGIVGLKTHCKLSLVVRQETDGLRALLPRRHRQLQPQDGPALRGPRHPHLRPAVGEDLTRLFNQLSGWAPRSKYKRLLVAPRTVQSGLIDLIDEAEIARARATASPAHPASRSTRSSTSNSSTRSTAPRRPGSPSTSSCGDLRDPPGCGCPA